MVEFNPNADYSARNRNFENGEKAQVIKQNGAYFVKNDDGSYEEVTKTRKGNLFHKAKFARNENKGLALEKSNDNVQVDSKAKLDAKNAQLAEVQQMKEAAGLGISAPGDTGYTGVVDEITITPNGSAENQTKPKEDDIAFSGINSTEIVYTKNRSTGKASAEARYLTGADLAEIREAVDNDSYQSDLAMNFKPKPQGAGHDKFAGMDKAELLEFADMYEDKQALKSIVAKLTEMGDNESAAKISKKIQDLQE